MTDEPIQVSAPQPLGEDAVLLEVSGEVTFANAAVLTRAVAETLGGPHPRVVVDISRVSFMDSSGMSSILTASLDADRQGRRVLVVHGQARPPGIFRFKGVERLLHLYTDRDAALADAP